ncbi:NAD(P)-binding protein [Hypomontagnella monticulosa]|nr:NAD(P)-binding protein [Hypomontagnella monticulosa]
MAVTFDRSPERQAGMIRFFRSQLCYTPPPVTRKDVDLSGKTAIVTGANVGLGLECARQLLDLGCRVILAVRSETKGEAARQQLSQGRNPQSTEIEVWKVDLASYDSILSFVERTKTLARLDVVVLNAGVYKVDESFSSATGFEEDIQINYLSNALLMLLLAPVLKEKKIGDTPGRIILVSSDLAAQARFRERKARDVLPSFKQKMAPRWDYQERYSTSKVLGQMFLTEMAKRVPSSAVLIAAANCGLCHGSDLMRDGEGRFAGYFFNTLMFVVGRSCAVGARIFVHAAASPTLGETVHGQYVEDATLRPMAPIVYKPEGKQVAAKLWEETLDELSFAGVRNIIDDLSK